MAKASALIQDFDSTVTNNGRIISIQYYNVTYSGADYDQEFVAASGQKIWIYGMPFPLDSKTGGEDRAYLEQGLITFGDKKLYIPGSVTVNSLTKIYLGSPTSSQVYAPIENGWIQHQIGGSPVYNKVYIRVLNNGSFIGEY